MQTVYSTTMAVFTQTADLSRIQDEIAEFLGLELTEKGLCGRADKLHKRLSGTKRVLVILDNTTKFEDSWNSISL